MGTKWDFHSAAQSAFALILLALGLMVWDQEGSPNRRSLYETRPNVFSQETVSTINKHLQWTEKQTELNSIATHVDNQELAPPARKGAPMQVLQGPSNPFETEDAARRVLEDLEPNAGRFDSPRLPAERITSLVEQKQWLDRYNKKQTEAFVKAVQQNAREAGYQLEINDQLKVTNVRRLPNHVGEAQPAGSR